MMVDQWHGPAFWERWYLFGGDSGPGSRGAAAAFKAEYVNRFVTTRGIASVLELGHGDGGQLGLARYPEYVGYDPSLTARERCRSRFFGDTTKRFVDVPDGQVADLTLSMDVLYHLLDDGEAA